MFIRHNIPALISYNALSVTNSGLAKSIRKLSTGLRINSAADDAAGLAISEKMRAQIRGLEQAERNAQDGVSMIQTAEGALEEVHSILQRMRELSVQSANDTLTQQDRSYIQDEIDQLRDEIDRIGNTTQFNKKKLLDGSAAVLWSSSDLSTKAVVNGGLRVTDQFGQKSVNEGNYKITTKASPGRVEVLKTNSLVFKHETTVNENLIPRHDVDVPVIHPHPDNVPIVLDEFGAAVTYTEDMPDRFPMGAQGVLSFVDELPYDVIIGGLEINVSVDEPYYFSNNLTPRDAPLLKADEVKGWFTRDDGTSGVIDGITFDEQLFPRLDTEPTRYSTLTLTSGGQEVAKVDFEVLAESYDVFWGSVRYIWDDDSAETEDPWPYGYYSGPRSNYFKNQEPVDISLMVGSTPYNLNADDVAGKLIQLNDVAGGTPYKLFNILDFRGVTADEIRGLVKVTDPDDLSYDESAAPITIKAKEANISPDDYIEYNPIGDLAIFKNSEGRSLLADPQTVTITQGDGKRTSFTLYADDTISSLVTKLNDAIGSGLGQAKYTDVVDKFAQFVSDPVENTALSAFGTIVISSVLPGEDGRLFFSGDEDLMKALGMNVIQQAKESSFDIMVEDAHTSQLMARSRVTGNKMIGVVHENVDVIFDPMSDTRAVYNENSGYFELVKTGGVETILHLADNTTVFQIGANEGEDMGIDIGDMRVHSLGLNRVLVVDREASARSITIIDSAIDKISKQRARLGSYQNRLEHTVNNLTTAAANLTASESRIRDADMAKEMMNFAKLNILLQSGSAMMTQANQLPQAVLSLLR